MTDTHVVSALRAKRAEISGYIKDLEKKVVRQRAALSHKDDYNTLRPHSGIGDLPPALDAKLSAPGMQRDGALRYMGASAPGCCLDLT